MSTEVALQTVLKLDNNSRHFYNDIIEDIDISKSKGENDAWIDFSYSPLVMATAELLKKCLEERGYDIDLLKFNDDNECSMTIKW